MAQPKRDLYQVWKDTGEFDNVMNFIRECSKKLVTQGEMCKYLGISQSQFSRLKKEHPDIRELQEKARLDMKQELIGDMFKLAHGYEVVEEEQYIEDKGKGEGQKRKIHRTKKQIPPNYKAIVYLLTKKFGREFSERYEEIKLMEQKVMLAKEEWNSDSEQTSESSNDED